MIHYGKVFGLTARMAPIHINLFHFPMYSAAICDPCRHHFFGLKQFALSVQSQTEEHVCNRGDGETRDSCNREKKKQTNEQKPPPNAIHILNAQQHARLFPAYVQTRGDV